MTCASNSGEDAAVAAPAQGEASAMLKAHKAPARPRRLAPIAQCLRREFRARFT
jgi:hypothetical protein